MATGEAVILDIVLRPAEITLVSCQPLQAAWSLLVYGLLYTARWRLAVPDPLVGVWVCTLGGLGDTWRSRTPRGGRSGTPSVCAERPSLEGHVTSPDPFPSRRWVRMAGVGRIVTGAVPSASRPRRRFHSIAAALGMAEQ